MWKHGIGIGVLMVAAVALAASQREGPRGDPGTLPAYGSHPGVCTWVGTEMLGPCDLDSEEIADGMAWGRIDSYSWGMEIWGYGWLYTPFADVEGADAVLSKATSGFGTVTVTRTSACAAPAPLITCDWFPRFKAEARIHEEDATCHSAGRMKGDCQYLNVHVDVKGGAAATGASGGSYTVEVGGVETVLTLTNPDANSFAGQAAGHDSMGITSETAYFMSGENSKVQVPGSLVFDLTQECETWLWESFPELDLHGECDACEAFQFVTYGWTQP